MYGNYKDAIYSAIFCTR